MWKEIIINSFKGFWEWFILIISIVIPVSISVSSSSPIINLIKAHPIFCLTLILACFISFAISIRLLITTISIIGKHKNNLPKLKTVKNDCLIFEASFLFATQMAVSVYFSDEETEKLIDYGFIETVNSKSGVLQVKTINNVLDETLVDYLLKNRNKIILKPSVPFDYFEGLYSSLIKEGEVNVKK